MSRSATPATRNEAMRHLKPPKTTPSAELTIGMAIRGSRELLREPLLILSKTKQLSNLNSAPHHEKQQRPHPCCHFTRSPSLQAQWFSTYCPETIGQWGPSWPWNSARNKVWVPRSFLAPRQRRKHCWWGWQFDIPHCFVWKHVARKRMAMDCYSCSSTWWNSSRTQGVQQCDPEFGKGWLFRSNLGQLLTTQD